MLYKRNFTVHCMTNWKACAVKNASLMHTNLRTTTIGLSLPVTTIRPFHIIRADETIIPKLRT